MTSREISHFIDIRNGELCADEVLRMVDVSLNPQINHIEYNDNLWNMWDNVGTHFVFKKRDW